MKQAVKDLHELYGTEIDSGDNDKDDNGDEDSEGIQELHKTSDVFDQFDSDEAKEFREQQHKFKAYIPNKTQPSQGKGKVNNRGAK